MCLKRSRLMLAQAGETGWKPARLSPWVRTPEYRYQGCCWDSSWRYSSWECRDVGAPVANKVSRKNEHPSLA